MKLPSFLFNKVKVHKTSLGNNEAFPPEEDFPFDYKILKTRFEEVINKINEYEDIESLEENYLISLLNKLITQCKEKENPIKEHIEKLCEKIVSETFRIPNETINLNIKLTDKLSPSKQFNLTPPTSKERTFDFEDLNDFKDSEKVILKRRLINSLIQGASYEYSTKTVIHLDEISSLLSDLKPLYERIIVINDFLLFTKKESITDDKIHQGAIVEVLLGRGDEKTEINVQGLTFPFLLNETFRGMFELFAAHGLPQDIDKANYILQQADFLLAEPWDLRMGVTLWNILSENVYGYESMPYFFMTLCEMNTDEFNLNLKEVFAQTKKGKQFIIDLNEYALKEAEYDSDIEPLDINDVDNELITDAYISSDGLDYYHLTDDDNADPNGMLEESNSFETWFGNSVLIDSEGKPIKMYHGTKNKTNNKKKIYINESQLYLLTESQESKSISAAKKLLIQRLGYNEQQADEFIRVKLRNDLPVLRTPEGGKFILGVTRMFIDGELSSANIIGNLNSTLKLVASDAHINEYDRNLNGMSASELINRFAKAMSDNLNAEKEEINQMVFDTPSDYEIVRIDSFEQASQYGEYTSWCVTHDEYMFDSYTSDGINQFYFCLKNGFENIKQIKGEGCPLDEYGLSMIAVSVNENGMLNTCTCRWNHDNGGNDNIMNTKEISQVIGMNFFEVFKPNNIWRDLVDNAMSRLNSGEPIYKVFDSYSDFVEGFVVVELKNKCNFINTNGELLSPNKWFDDCDDFYNGFATVKLNYKFNYINTNGELLSPNQWFDRCSDFVEGFAAVKLNGKQYYINNEGQIIGEVNENINKQKKIYINESQLSLLTESQASKSEHQAVILVMNRFRYSKEQAYDFVHEKIRHDIYPLKDKELGKFILGVTRMCCDGELNDARAINDINATLILLKAHLNEYDRNLNGLSAQELISRFAQIRQDNLDAEKSKIDQMTFGESNYKIVPINSFEEAEQYYRYTYSESPWCITHMENMFETYTCDGINQIYFCLRNGFENEEPIVGENVPLDDYGLSMISVIVNENGELAHCTTRWNHKNGGTDNSMSAKGVSEVVGVNFYQVFKPNNKWSELIENVKQRIANGEPLDSVFDRVYNFSEGLAMVKLNKKCNYIKQDGEFLTDKWYDACSNFINGFGIVKSNNKCNFINQEGNLLSPNKWYDYCNEFKDGFGIVHLNDKCTYIKQDGEYLINEWFDYCESFSNGFAKVELNGKGYNFINANGKLLFPNQWFVTAKNFGNGLVKVELKHRFNVINSKGELVSPNQWFDYCYDFENSFSRVELNNKYNFINTNGELLSPNQWYDFCHDFYNGFAVVRLDNKYNYLNQNGKILSPNQWFDKCENFYNGFAKVKLNGKWYKISNSGELFDENGKKLNENINNKLYFSLFK